jgi:hypothetical protein
MRARSADCSDRERKVLLLVVVHEEVGEAGKLLSVTD